MTSGHAIGERQRVAAARRTVTVAALAFAATAVAFPAAGVAATPTPSPAARVQIVRIPFPKDDGTLTPYTFDLGYQLMTLVYDTLLWRDKDGAPRPWLAQTVDTSSDGLTVTVHLAAGARWQDGPPVTSADVAFTFDYVAHHPHPRFTSEVSDVAGVDTPDAETAVIRLVQPSLGFDDEPLADLPILPQHLWAGLPAGTVAPPGLPIGSGPYRLISHTAAEGYRFEADPQYFRGAPAVSTIQVPIIRDAPSTALALERRSVDMLPVTLPADLDAAVQDFGVRDATGVSYLGTVLMFNTRGAPFDSAPVRRAVSEALDLHRIADSVGGSPVPADNGYIHPASPWASSIVLHRFDVTSAAAGLASVSATPVVVLAPDNDTVKIEAARQVTLALARAGLPATEKTLSTTELDTAVGADGSAPTFQMAIWDAPALVSYDPDRLATAFGSQSAFNYAGYANASFDQLAHQIASAPDSSTRRVAVSSALQLLADDAPVVPLFFEQGAFAYRPAIYDGWVYVKGEGILDKLSFVQPAAPVAASGDLAPPLEPPGTGGVSSVTAAAGVLLAAALAAGVLQLIRTRRQR